jgi:hydroxymethylglutaryl-CoA lyase
MDDEARAERGRAIVSPEAREPFTLIEVSPRDGLQNESRILSTESKAKLITDLAQAGAPRIEVTSFVRPSAIPQLADADELIDSLSAQDTGSTSFIALVLNQRGVERALRHERIDEINLVVPCTPSFGRANQGATTDDVLSALPAMLDATKSAGRQFSVTLAVAFGCPYEGTVDHERFVSVVDSVVRHDLDELAIADTLGCAVPQQVTERFGAAKSMTDVPLRVHLHDTRRTGLANAWAAYHSGVDRFDASAGGVGGCPFAPGAAGNIGTEDLLWMLDASGVDVGHLDATSFARIGEDLCRQLGTDPRSGVGRSGVFPPAVLASSR